MKENRITELFGIKYPIIAGGMVWCSSWRMAAAVSNAGGLGLLGAGSLPPELLREHIQKMKKAVTPPGSDGRSCSWGVNLPMMNPLADAMVDIIIEEGVKIVFTSAGSPKKYTARFHEAGIKVAHVVSSSKFARKCEEAGVDAVVAEGFEAGGHNGKEETSTMVLIPEARKATSLPLIAAGGIGSGQAMMAAMALGAEGVQIGTLFALSQESSASEAFKQLCINLNEGDTMLALKRLSPTRLIKNAFFEKMNAAEEAGASADELREMIGFGATRRGIFEGDIENGELEIGQVVSSIKEIKPVAQIIEELVSDFEATRTRIASL